MRHYRNLSGKKILMVDKQGELKTKRSSMHPAVLLTQQFWLMLAVWLVIILFLAKYTGTF
jgi:hypothetical protein